MISDSHKNTAPELNGLVLAGGLSRRMGQDKSRLVVNGAEQHVHLAGLLRPWCREVFVSCRAGQEQEIASRYPVIADIHDDLGPYGGILSAFARNADCAWLVVACDLLLLTPRSLSALVQGRNASAVATTFRSPHDSLPEPLITIWEPASYPLLLSGVAEGFRCPRKILLRSAVHLLEPQHPEELLNANTPDDLDKARTLLRTKNAADEK